MRRSVALQGVRGFLNLLHRWESAELNKAAAEVLARAFAGRDWLNPESTAIPG